MTDKEEASIRELREVVGTLSGVVEGLGTTLKSHVEHAKERHETVMATVADLRAERKRTLITVISEIGTDTVPIPFTSGRELRMRAIAGLVGLSVGSLLALGWAGPAAEWISSYVAAKANAAPPPVEAPQPGPPEPTP